MDNRAIPVPWLGRLGLRLSLAFVAVAVVAVAAGIGLSALTVNGDVAQMAVLQQGELTDAIATAAGLAYDVGGGWHPQDLDGVMQIATNAGATVRVISNAGIPIRSSIKFASSGTTVPIVRPVVVRGIKVGHVVVRLGDQGLGAAIARFEAERSRARFIAFGLAALFAALVGVIVSRRITAPVDRIIRAARAWGRGQRHMRVGDVSGFGEIRELAFTFDQMADAREEQDQVRRNLVADVAHELRTPIAVLQAGHEAILDGVTTASVVQIQSLHDEVLRLARMVGDLQRLASAEAAALQLALMPSDLAAIAGTAADSLAESFQSAGIGLHRRLTTVQVRCDPLRMHEIVTNLLTNALKFTPAHGSVVIETGTDPLSKDVAVLCVRDTGIGISADELPRVAERFFRGQRSAGTAGSGIGLTIVSELVRAHHGEVRITSEPGQGTTVTITLPRFGEAA